MKNIAPVIVCLCCFLIPAHSQQLEWFTSGGGNQNIDINGEVEYIHSLVAADGAIYATAFATGTETTVDDTSIPKSNIWFLLKFDVGGNLIWYKNLDASFGPADVALDADENIWVSGSTGSRCYLMKFNAAGDILLDKELMKNAKNPAPYGIATDPEGNVYVSGIYQNNGGTFTEEDSTFIGLSSSYHGFLIKYTNAGVFQWMATTNHGGQGWFRDVKTDANGGVIVTGDFDTETDGPLIIGNTEISSVSNSSFTSQEALIARYSTADGTLDWVKQTKGLDNEFGNKVTIDADNNVYVTGTFTGNTVFEGTTVNGQGSYDIFIIKLDEAGSLQWIKSAGGPNGSIQLSNDFLVEAGRTIATDAEKNVYIGGTFISTATFGEGTSAKVVATTNNKQAGFLAKYSPQGDLLWVNGGTGEKSAVLDLFIYDDAIYFAGNFFPTSSFLGQELPVTVANSTNFYLGLAKEPEEVTGTADPYTTSFSVYPNPAHTTFHVRFDSPIERELRLFDLNGKLVASSTTRDNESSFAIATLHEGLYTLIVSDKNGSSSYRIMKN